MLNELQKMMIQGNKKIGLDLEKQRSTSATLLLQNLQLLEACEASVQSLSRGLFFQVKSFDLCFTTTVAYFSGTSWKLHVESIMPIHSSLSKITFLFFIFLEKKLYQKKNYLEVHK